MKLNGNKALATVFALAAGSAHADINTPELTTFSAGTPAKANEVNANFEALKAYSEQLQELIQSQSQPTYDIEVKGDGEVIGYTNRVLLTFDKPYIAVKTTKGMVALTPGYGEFAARLRSYDTMRDERSGDSNYINEFSDDQCQNIVYALSSGDGNPLLFTKVANTLDEDILFVTEDKVFHAAKGTLFNPNATTVYQLVDDVCTQAEWFTSGLTIPLVEETSLKSNYSSIEIQGYVSN